MPYIRPEQRPALDRASEDLIALLRSLPADEQDGALNYTITRLLKGLYPLRYVAINRAIGVLECIKQEYYRAVAGPYEEGKRLANGDVEAPASVGR